MADAVTVLCELLRGSDVGWDGHVEVKLLTSDGANYTSALYSVSIPAKGLKLFAKVANVGEKMRAVMDAEQLFRTEQYIYTKIVKIFDRLQEENQVPTESKFLFPKFYACNPVLGEETVVLEDLTARGFGSYSRFKSIDWEHASSAVGTLAKFHALSFAYQKRYPEEYERVIERLMFKPRISNDKHSEQAVVRMISSATEVITDERNKKKLLELLGDFLSSESFYKFKMPLGVAVLTHGDYRPSNLMFRNVDGGVETIVVDYQTVHAGSPVADLLYLIFTGSDQEFRAQHHEQLLDHYHSQLTAALDTLNIDVNEVYPREIFDSELLEMLPHILRMSVVILPVVTVDEADAPRLCGDADVSTFALKPNELFAKRFNGIVSDCVKWGVL